MSTTADNQGRVTQAIADYMRRVDAGEPVDRDQFIESYAEVAADVGRYLDNVALIEEMAGPTPAEQSQSPADAARRETVSASQGGDSVPEKRATVADGSLSGYFGRYKIEKMLGEGAMGTVYLARDTQLDRQVALKVPKFKDDDLEMMERFYREARSAAKLRHRHICPVHDIGEIDGIKYISIAYIKGHPLSAYVSPEKPQSERNIAVIVRKLALALDVAHRDGIIHRDLKPANVMVDKKSEPVIMDFGLAREINNQEDHRLTQTGTIMGSPAYMSPEQVNADNEQIGPCSDIYSLGVMLYELLTGYLPFEGSIAAVIGQILMTEPDKPSTFRPGLDPRLEEICAKMMAKEIDERYTSMKDVADALTAFLKNPAKPGAKRSIGKLESFAPVELKKGRRTVARKQSGRRLAGPFASADKASGGRQPADASKLQTVFDRFKNLPRWTMGVAAALGSVLLILGVTILVRTPDGTLIIEIKDSNIIVKIDGDSVDFSSGLKQEIEKKLGPHKLEVMLGKQRLTLNDSTTVRLNGKDQQVELTVEGVTLQANMFEFKRGKKLAMTISMSTKPVVDPPRPPLPSSLPDRLDDLATGEWVDAFETDHPKNDGNKVQFKDGVLELNAHSLDLSQFSGRNMIVRARVKKGTGQNLSIGLRRQESGENVKAYTAWMNTPWFFGIGRSDSNLWLPLDRGRASKEEVVRDDEGFVELAAVAIGDRLGMYVNGKKYIDVTETIYASGTIQLGTNNGRSQFKDVQVMLLDDETSDLPTGQWVRLLENEEQLKQWQATNITPEFKNGIVTLARGKKVDAADSGGGELGRSFDTTAERFIVHVRHQKVAGFMAGEIVRIGSQNFHLAHFGPDKHELWATNPNGQRHGKRAVHVSTEGFKDFADCDYVFLDGKFTAYLNGKVICSHAAPPAPLTAVALDVRGLKNYPKVHAEWQDIAVMRLSDEQAAAIRAGELPKYSPESDPNTTPGVLVQTGIFNAGAHPIRFSRDGKFVLGNAYGDDLRPAVFDVETRKLVRLMDRGWGEQDTGGWTTAFAVSPVASLAAAGSSQGRLMLWDYESGKLLYDLKGHTELVQEVVFTPDGKQLISTGRDRTLRVWNVESGRQVRILGGVDEVTHANSLAVSPDGQRLVEAGKSLLNFRDFTTGKVVWSKTDKKRVFYNEVAFSSDGKRLATYRIGDDRQFQILDTTDGSVISTISDLPDGIDGADDLRFFADDRLLISAHPGNTAFVWNTDDGRLLQEIPGAGAADISPDGQSIVTKGPKAIVRLWRVDEEKLRQALAGLGDTQPELITTLKGHKGGANGVAFTPDGQQLVSAASDGVVRLWDVVNGTMKSQFKARECNAMALSPDGTLAAIACRLPHPVELWDLAKQKRIRLLPSKDGKDRLTTSVAFSPDGKTVAAVNSDSIARIWNVATGKQIHQFTAKADPAEPGGSGSGVVYSPDGRYVIARRATVNQPRAYVFDLQSGKIDESRSFDSKYGTDGQLAISPDGKQLALMNYAHRAQLVDWTEKQPWATLKLSAAQRAVSYSPDGELIAIGGVEGRVFLIEQATHRQVAELKLPHDNVVTAAVAFSADGKYLAASESVWSGRKPPAGKPSDFHVCIWRLKPDTPLDAETNSSENETAVSALQFDGVDSHVVIEPLRFDAKPPWTIEAVTTPQRVNSDRRGWMTLVGDVNLGGAGIVMSDGQWEFRVGGSGRRTRSYKYAKAISEKTALVDERVHIAGVWDGQEVRLYVNGKLESRVKSLGQPQLTGLPFLIGADPGKRSNRVTDPEGHYKGTVDELRISKGARYTADFVPQLQFETDDETLVLYHIDEGTGTVLKDASGNGNDGDIVSAKWIQWVGAGGIPGAVNANAETERLAAPDDAAKKRWLRPKQNSDEIKRLLVFHLNKGKFGRPPNIKLMEKFAQDEVVERKADGRMSSKGKFEYRFNAAGKIIFESATDSPILPSVPQRRRGSGESDLGDLSGGDLGGESQPKK